MVDPAVSLSVSDVLSDANSHRAAIFRFDQQEVAEKYPTRFGDGWRDRLEVRSIRRALTAVPPGAHVLDLPCGSGACSTFLPTADTGSLVLTARNT